MTTEPKPTGMTADRKAATLTIEWDTGESFSLPFALLRNACPCAQCSGGHEHMSPEPNENVFSIPLTNVNITQLVKIDPVGNYAVSIHWGDGHSAGIFAWHFLYILSERMEAEKEN